MEKRSGYSATGHDDAGTAVALAAQAVVAQDGAEPGGTIEVTILRAEEPLRRRIRGPRVYPAESGPDAI